MCLGDESCVRANAEILKFTGHLGAGKGVPGIPTWLAMTYMASNVVLNSLNFFWFGRMIETVSKRFRGPVSGKEERKKEEVMVEGPVLEAAEEPEKEAWTGDGHVKGGEGEARRRKV